MAFDNDDDIRSFLLYLTFALPSLPFFISPFSLTHLSFWSLLVHSLYLYILPPSPSFPLAHPPSLPSLPLSLSLLSTSLSLSLPISPHLSQVEVIQWLLTHNPHDRPSAKQLLQSPLLPLKMEDEQLEEVLTRTLQVRESCTHVHLHTCMYVLPVGGN